MASANPARLSPRAAALEVLRILREAGHIAYLAGGCVRDEVLGLTPKDYDVATDAPPEKVRALFRGSRAVGESFGVVLVCRGGQQIEVATFRAESGYADGRRPDHITFTDAAHDAQRRDFTINGLFAEPASLTPGSETHGNEAPESTGGDCALSPPPRGEVGRGDDEKLRAFSSLGSASEDVPISSQPSTLNPPLRLIDFVNGQADLQAGIIRAIGAPEARFAEDHLRLLRAVRFAARFGFMIEPVTRTAMVRHAAKLAGISRERIGQEVRWMLEGPRPHAGAQQIQSLELDGPTLQEEHHDDPLPMLERLGTGQPWETCLAAWAVDRHFPGPEPLTPSALASFTPNLVRQWRRALCLSNDQSAALKGALLVLGELLRWSDLSVAARKRLLARPGAVGALALLHAGTDRPELAELEPIVQREAGELLQGEIAPEPWVTGDDLVALGAVPGPAFKRVLDQAYDLQLEGKLTHRAEALTWLRAHLPGT